MQGTRKGLLLLQSGPNVCACYLGNARAELCVTPWFSSRGNAPHPRPPLVPKGTTGAVGTELSLLGVSLRHADQPVARFEAARLCHKTRRPQSASSDVKRCQARTRANSTTRARASGDNRHSDRHTPGHIPKVQDAFKILMIHWILQFATRIAFRCALHRSPSRDIHR